MKSDLIRQGDVMVERIAALPAELKPVSAKGKIGNRFVLAHGEVTGHHHSIADTECEMYEDAQGNYFIRVPQGRPANLTHQEHSTLVLAPGDYRVTRQREYTPEELRQVRD